LVSVLDQSANDIRIHGRKEPLRTTERTLLSRVWNKDGLRGRHQRSPITEVDLVERRGQLSSARERPRWERAFHGYRGCGRKRR